MVTLTMRVSEQDAQLIREFADFDGVTLSDFMRDAVMEKIEDFHDLQALRQALKEDDGTRYSLDEVAEELGL